MIPLELDISKIVTAVYEFGNNFEEEAPKTADMIAADEPNFNAGSFLLAAAANQFASLGLNSDQATQIITKGVAVLQSRPSQGPTE